MPSEAPRDDSDVHARFGVRWKLAVPEHLEVRCGELVLPRKVHPDLKQLERIGLVGMNEREHLGMNNPRSSRQPLNIAPAIARRGAQRIAVVDQAAADDGYGLEAAMGVLRKAGDARSVVHPPAVFSSEVLPDFAPGEGSGGGQIAISLRIGVVVVDAKKKRVLGWPLKSEGESFEDGAGHRQSIEQILRRSEAAGRVGVAMLSRTWRAVAARGPAGAPWGPSGSVTPVLPNFTLRRRLHVEGSDLHAGGRDRERASSDTGFAKDPAASTLAPRPSGGRLRR